MKRFSAALMAAVTALSLSTAVAQAKDQTSSTISDYETGRWLIDNASNPDNVHPGFGSAIDAYEDTPANAWALKSSLKNDAANNYRIGTTYTILWATGLTLSIASILAYLAREAGLLPK
ncbi:hypothetical protein N7326_07305 [Corynebacterium sp. ES2794-CONJ1]|uniref:hypothetical protein n=1 Tax=unclassified Corynebacterium TaxID=2624378 RepID=UPI00216AFDB7|nr:MULTISPECIES: hypothetical protein [unclassified Corynebacterium]MCS4532365.1 hypothetical protein [Corynebacterium sp. ES2730-CONJ]MCU9519672.1 hypothetical protein [Corynebacterium sp. ES2794-CONJ1]